MFESIANPLSFLVPTITLKDGSVVPMIPKSLFEKKKADRVKRQQRLRDLGIEYNEKH